jgi:ketosteroid isomerase-like protein
MAYTAGLEHISASVEGQPRTYTLRATQMYRREGGEWKVAHRHGDTWLSDGHKLTLARKRAPCVSWMARVQWTG